MTTNLTDCIVENAYIEITSICNGQCSYCYNNSRATGEHAPTKLIEQLLEDVHTMNPEASLTISGGEPLLHPDFRSILRLAKGLFGRVLLITNASKLRHAIKHDRCQLQDLHFQVTLDSLCRDEQDTLRGLGSYQNTRDLRRLVGPESHLSLRVNISRRNMQDLESIALHAAGWGFNEVSYGFIAPFGRASGQDIINAGTSPNDQFVQITERLERQKQTIGRTIDVSLVNCYPRTDCNLQQKGQFTVSPKITSNGDVFPCLYAEGATFLLGNVFDAPLHAIMAGDPFAVLRQRLLSRSETMDSCHDCMWRPICFRGCPAIAQRRFGTVEHDSGDCEYLRSYYRKKVTQAI